MERLPSIWSEEFRQPSILLCEPPDRYQIHRENFPFAASAHAGKMTLARSVCRLAVVTPRPGYREGGSTAPPDESDGPAPQ